MASRGGDPPESSRHSSESSGAYSWMSQDTVKDSRNPRATQNQTLAPSNGRSASPYAGSSSATKSKSSSRDRRAPPALGPPTDFSSFSWASPDVSPTDQRHFPFGNHRKALAMLGADEPPPPASNSSPRPDPRNPFSGDYFHADHGTSAYSSKMAASDGPGSFFHDSSEHEYSPASATFRHGSRPHAGYAGGPMDQDREGDHRRPSVASATTVSSQGSKSSTTGGRFRKKLQGFFGDEYSGHGDWKHDPDNSSHPNTLKPSATEPFKKRERANSDGAQNFAERSRNEPSSNHQTRSNTPFPPSEITPWEYQDFDDIPHLGEAPVRKVPAGYDDQPGKQHHSRRPFTGHRHSRSKEEKPTAAGDLAGYPARPATGRDDLSLGSHNSRENYYPTPGSSSGNLAGRSTSPTPSVQSTYAREQGYNSPGNAPNNANKRSLLDKFRRPKAHGPLKHLPMSKGTQSTTKLPRRDTSPPTTRGRQGSVENAESGRGLIGPSKLRNRRGGNEGPGKDNNDPNNQNMWELDTDLEHMEGIVREKSPMTPNGRKQSDSSAKRREEARKMDGLPPGNWDAPDSWHVKRPTDENTARLPSKGEGVTLTKLDRGTQYFIRVFRIDSTFATLSAGVDATVADVLLMLGRKSFLTDHLDNYEIVMRKNDLSRQLDPGEKLVLIQKHMLEQVGYTKKDRLEEIGREDHSYILRFTFLPTKLSGYSSLHGEPGFKQQNFSNVDLSGRSLVTIPITLYQRSNEIVSLNLSRNLALDVPKDFIHGCVNLREIKFSGNEALQLPESLSMATRVSYLDISSNLLEDLEHAHLDRLERLVSIKVFNNRLSVIPSYFGNFDSLRSLNLSSNNFEVFPDFLGNLKSLTDLDISFNNIAELQNIGKLTSLERLWMTNNLLKGPLDESFKDLVNLKELDARFNDLTNIDSLSGLPRLELLMAGHNQISKFRGSFPKMRSMFIDHNPTTGLELTAPMPLLTNLNANSGKLVQFKDYMFENLPNLVHLVLDKNHFVSMSPHIGKLRRLEFLSIIKNPLSSLPPTIGCLTELKYLNLRECNLRRMPPEIWYCLKLETLNVSSNLLDSFPKHGSPPPQLPSDIGTPSATPAPSTTPSHDELSTLSETEPRRPSQTSGGALSAKSSPKSGSLRKPSVASSYGAGARKVSGTGRTYDGSPASRKDSNFSQHAATTFGGSLRNLYLADNRLEDDVFRELSLIPDLRVVNLSYNELTELPQGLLRRWHSVTELYLSGNELSSLPSDDLDEHHILKVLHLNANRFQVLPAELCKVSKLVVLDVGSNALKYNVSNWPYDWNWNWNRNLKYLNFSGNKRLDIKPNTNTSGPAATKNTDLTDFNSLTHLRVLGLIDVTLTKSTIPEETEDRRVRTSASLAGSLSYGMADSLGQSEHLSIYEMIVPRLKMDYSETVMGMFDGQTQTHGGSRVAKYLHENFMSAFATELKKLRSDEQETPLDALRRTFLAMNKNMAFLCYKALDQDVRQYREGAPDQKKVRLTKEDVNSGGAATVMFLKDMDLYVANVGDVQAILVKADGSKKDLTQLHDPAEKEERKRIRAAGGYVSRDGKLNDVLSVSRSFGHFPLMPAVIAAPHTMHVNLTEQDEMIILASKELWDYVTQDVVVDVTRAERRDLMIAAQKIRDLAISFGATNKLMVMILGVGDLKKRQRRTYAGQSLSLGSPDEQILPTVKRPKKPRDMPSDSRLARFDYVDAPVGELAIIFTDIKKSTSLWENCADAMRSAIQIHNDILRRQLGIIGGYEVKTEGDAFMVAFATTTAALLWCFNCQTQLLEAEWPTEILEQPQCQIQYDMENNVMFRGLSVRMGVHWGEPVSEKDPVTNRMDYFGPMVNRASRISAEADGGQIFVSSDFMSDFQRNLEVFADSERAASTGSEENYDSVGYNVRRELQQLNSQGFVIKDQGERKLKGLENPEPLYLVYPHSLSGRLTSLEQDEGSGHAPTTISEHSQLQIQTDLIWRLWEITLRLERLVGSLEYPGEAYLKEPNVALFNVVKNHGGELADSTVLSLVEQQVTRIEATTNTLSIRNMMRPFKPGDTLNDHAVPIGEVMQQLQTQLAEYRALKEQIAVNGNGNGYGAGADKGANANVSYLASDPHYVGDSISTSPSESSESLVQIGGKNHENDDDDDDDDDVTEAED